jgi:peroxiredoxin
MKKLLVVFILLSTLSINSFAQTDCFLCSQRGDFTMQQIANGKIDSITKVFIDNYILGCKAPAFKTCNISGDSIIFDKIKNKVIVIDFWFMSCPPCITELPGLNKLVKEFENKDVVFIAISRDSKEGIKKYFLKNYKLDFIIVPDGGDIADNYCVPYFGWPTTFIINRDRKVKYMRHGGVADKEKKYEICDKLKPEIEKCLNE